MAPPSADCLRRIPGPSVTADVRPFYDSCGNAQTAIAIAGRVRRYGYLSTIQPGFDTVPLFIL